MRKLVQRDGLSVVEKAFVFAERELALVTIAERIA